MRRSRGHRIRTRPVAFEEITALFLTNAAGPIYLPRIFLDLARDGPGIVASSTASQTIPAGAPSSIVPARPP